MEQPLVFIILLNYNGYHDTIECVKSLKKIRYTNFKILIVDNSSTDNSVQILEEELNDCIIIQNTQNGGFAQGNNVGIKYALENGAVYIWLLNNDTIVDAYSLNCLIDTIENTEGIGIVTSKIYYFMEPDRIWFAGGELDYKTLLPKHLGYKVIENGQFDTIKEVSFATGCSMLIKRELFKNVGLLPEEYFMYFEDVDFCISVLQSGYKIIYNPQSVIYHKIGASNEGEGSVFSIKWGNRNRLILMKKYKNVIKNYHYSLVIFYLTRIAKGLIYIISGNIEKTKSIVHGIKMANEYSRTIGKF